MPSGEKKAMFETGGAKSSNLGRKGVQDFTVKAQVDAQKAGEGSSRQGGKQPGTRAERYEARTSAKARTSTQTERSLAEQVQISREAKEQAKQAALAQARREWEQNMQKNPPREVAPLPPLWTDEELLEMGITPEQLQSFQDQQQ